MLIGVPSLGEGMASTCCCQVAFERRLASEAKHETLPSWLGAQTAKPGRVLYT